MTRDATPATLQRLLATEFGRRGWSYDLDVGKGIVEAIEAAGNVDPQALAKRVPATFLEQNSMNREDVVAAIERAVGDCTPIEDSQVTTVVIHDNRYSLQLAEGASINQSTVNIGRSVINLGDGSSKTDLLEAVAALVRSGLAGNWNPDVARELQQLIDDRGDLEVVEVQEVASQVVKADPTAAERVRGLLADIAASAIGGALGTGLSAGLGAALAHLG